MATKTVVCPECGSPAARGRYSCSECGALLASVGMQPRTPPAAGVAPAGAPFVPVEEVYDGTAATNRDAYFDDEPISDDAPLAMAREATYGSPFDAAAP